MSVRDLGYRAYEGDRLPASHNTWVMLRHSLSRAWGSWLVKIACFGCVLPAIVVGVIYGVMSLFTHGGAQPAQAVLGLILLQMWIFVLMTTAGAGAAAIAEDLQHRAFQFFFAKPVTPAQYLGARMGAVAIFAFGVTFGPVLALILVYTGISHSWGTADQAVEWIGLLLPALVDCALVAVVTSTISVALSSLSRSRALTMSAWLVLFVVPPVLAGIVRTISHWPWLSLISLSSMLSIVGDALFKRPPDTDVRWFHALPILVGLAAGAVWFAYARLRRAEVIT